MTNLTLKALILGMLLLVAGAPVSMGHALPPAETLPTVVRLIPGDVRMDAGQTVHVEMWVENVSALYGADVQLSFDPLAFQVVDANPSLAGVQISLRYDLLTPGFLLHREADNTLGRIWYANSMVNPAEPAYGSGALFEFELTAIKNGIYPIIFGNVQLVAYGAEPIAAEVRNASYTVGYALFFPLILREI